MTEQFSDPHESGRRLAQVLQPLVSLGEAAAKDVEREAKVLQAVERKYQAVKALYATAFRRVQALEETVTQLRKNWEEEPC